MKHHLHSHAEAADVANTRRDHACHEHRPRSNPEQPFTDPVCGMHVAPDARKNIAHAGRTYRFLGTKCMDRFRATPPVTISSGAHPPAPAAASEGAVYTCPMHPEIRQPAPGNCPVCGMTLEPELLALAPADVGINIARASLLKSDFRAIARVRF